MSELIGKVDHRLEERDLRRLDKQARFLEESGMAGYLKGIVDTTPNTRFYYSDPVLICRDDEGRPGYVLEKAAGNAILAVLISSDGKKLEFIDCRREGNLTHYSYDGPTIQPILGDIIKSEIEKYLHKVGITV